MKERSFGIVSDNGKGKAPAGMGDNQSEWDLFLLTLSDNLISNGFCSFCMLLIRIEKLEQEIEGYKAEIATNKKTIEVINYLLGSAKPPSDEVLTEHGGMRLYQRAIQQVVARQDLDEKMEAKLEKKKAELIEANGITIKQMEIANDQIKVAAAEKNAAKPQEGSAFLSFF